MCFWWVFASSVALCLLQLCCQDTVLQYLERPAVLRVSGVEQRWGIAAQD